MNIKRKKTRVINVGKLKLGGNNPIRVQSMNSTETANIKTTVSQINRLVKNGCELGRVAVPDRKSLDAYVKILKSVNIPLIADIHFNPAFALEAVKRGAQGIRINPGNIGSKAGLKDLLKAAKDRNTCIRIGVNSGSLHQKFRSNRGKVTVKGLVDSALDLIEFFESNEFFNTKVSIKSSDPLQTVEANRLFSNLSDCPLHIGVTEAGTLLSGSVRSSVALGILLSEGIGDTIRVSLSDDPVREVNVAYEILKSLGLRKRGVTVISCPTCSRKSFDVIKTAKRIERELSNIEKPLNVAVMGCIVNGPGEASHADVGIAGSKGKSVLFEKGKIVKKLPACALEKILIERARDLAKK